MYYDSNFEELSGHYTLGERYFYSILKQLAQKYGSISEWVFVSDLPRKRRDGTAVNFHDFGFSPRVCKSARRKLQKEGVIKCRYAYDSQGHRAGTKYKLIKLAKSDKIRAAHAAIFHQLDVQRLSTIPQNSLQVGLIRTEKMSTVAGELDLHSSRPHVPINTCQ